jgi:hypothetical protein
MVHFYVPLLYISVLNVKLLHKTKNILKSLSLNKKAVDNRLTAAKIWYWDIICTSVMVYIVIEAVVEVLLSDTLPRRA